jgi:hypothetical protein
MNYEQTLKSNFMDKNKHLITIKKSKIYKKFHNNKIYTTINLEGVSNRNIVSL